MSSAEPIVVTVSHRLGRDEAKRRIDNGLDRIRGELAPVVKSAVFNWEGYRLNFHFSAMMQSVSGAIEVHDQDIRIELSLPRLLQMIAQPLIGRIQQQATALLENKSRG